MFYRLLEAIGRKLATAVNKPHRHYECFSAVPAERLHQIMRPGDVLLVDGSSRVSTAIKYLTQSTWSHSCLYVGDALAERYEGEERTLIEADIAEGVVAISLSRYEAFNTRICRPVNLTEEDASRLVAFVIQRLGFKYDLKNIVDLARYFLPVPPVPSHLRRRLLAFGSGDPTRAICSTLIAQAFQSIRYPILPRYGFACGDNPGEVPEEDVLRVRHFSHFTPHDFDLSPYFRVLKPTIEHGFNYKALKWG